MRFLALEKFAPASFSTDREKVVRFVSGLRFSLRVVVSMLLVLHWKRLLSEGEISHEKYYMKRGGRPQGQ